MTALLRTLALLLASLWLTIAPAHAQAKGPLVLAAASLQEAMTEAANVWAARKHPRPVISFAASSALARQIEAGAPADLFVSADEEWMDYVAAKGLLRPKTRVSFLANRLVLIAPASSKMQLAVRPKFPLARALGSGKLAMANPDAVPAGKYGKEALTRLGVWPTVSAKVARAENVRAAMALVERGAAPLGIVYATDAKASRQVRVAGTFPPNTHTLITYPLATLKSASNPQTEAFLRFLLSREGKAIFVRHGFTAR